MESSVFYSVTANVVFFVGMMALVAYNMHKAFDQSASYVWRTINFTIGVLIVALIPVYFVVIL